MKDAGKLLTRFTLLAKLDLDELLAPTLDTFENKLIAAGISGLDDREPHPPFAMKTRSVQQRIVPPRTQLEIRHATLRSLRLPTLLYEGEPQIEAGNEKEVESTKYTKLSTGK
jgi:hypothetical protein